MKGKLIDASPNDIIYCTAASGFTDFTHKALNPNHPHASIDRGWFSIQSAVPRIIQNDWDITAGPKFTDLVEYQSIANHIAGVQVWRESEFALRIKRWMLSGGAVRELGVSFSSADDWLLKREQEIDKLIEGMSRSYQKNPVYSDNIGVNITRTGALFFNKNGHHRFSIAKCLKLSHVFVVPIVSFHRL